MDTKEELINGLQHALNLMRKSIELENKRNNIRARYVPNIAPKKLWTGKNGVQKLLLVEVGITLLLSFTMVWNIIAQIFWLMFNENNTIARLCAWIIVAGIALPISFIVKSLMNKSIKKKNKEIQQKNTEINTSNNSLYIAETEVIQQIKHIQDEYARNIAPWYPPKYCFIDAAEFFLDAFINRLADNWKDVTNLYEDTMHKQRIEHMHKQSLDMQERQIRQQQLTNILNAGQIVMQAGIQGSIDKNTQAINNLNRRR